MIFHSSRYVSMLCPDFYLKSNKNVIKNSIIHDRILPEKQV